MTSTCPRIRFAAFLLFTALILGSAASAAAFHGTWTGLGRFADGIVSEEAAGNPFMRLAGLPLDIADTAYKLEPKEAAKHLGASDYIFIDIRERVEVSVKSIPGFINIRTGDLINGGEYRKIDKSKKIVLICGSAERGSNVAIVLRLKGYQAFYVADGVRGWVAQGLKFIGSKKLDLPDAKNLRTGVSAGDARDMLIAGKAVLIDVRSPAEYARFHVEGSLNIPLVSLTTAQLHDALRRIPKDKQVIGVAYDRFGAYYCKILGYMVQQQKGQFAGTLKVKAQNQAL